MDNQAAYTNVRVQVHVSVKAEETDLLRIRNAAFNTDLMLQWVVMALRKAPPAFRKNRVCPLAIETDAYNQIRFACYSPDIFFHLEKCLMSLSAN
jgi:hypothetical protein